MRDMRPLQLMLRRTSRTFALSIEQLPGDLSDALTIAYLLLRVSDYLEDNKLMPAPRKHDLLMLWDATLAGDAPAGALDRELHRTALPSADPEAEVALRHQALLEPLATLPDDERQSIVRYVREATRGMARWQRQGPLIANEAELDDYMHHVAGLVGYLVTDLFARRYGAIARKQQHLMPLAREFGLALQTVNVIRGLKRDFERGWVFVPASYYRAVNLSAAQLFEPQHLPRSLEVLGQLTAKAERHLRCGLTYVCELPRSQHRLRLACMWPLFFAVKTLAVSRGNEQAFLSEVKIGRDEVKRIVSHTSLWGWSNRWLKRYYHQLLDEGLERPG
jgi:farnesyl-diphosphate farnesyltransferase